MPGVMQRGNDMYGYGQPQENGYDAYRGREDSYRMRENPYPPREEPMYARSSKQNGVNHADYNYRPREMDYQNGYNTAPERMSERMPARDDRDPFGNPVYDMDHLATFTVGSREGLLFPEDGIRKLRQMEQNSGIWTMRCRMVIERKHLVVIDGQTGEEMERFPLPLVSEPAAVSSSDRRDIYNNIVLFIVVEDPKKKNSNPSEMHIFQCVSRPAQEVVDDIKVAKMGKVRPSSGGPPPRIPPPPIEPAPEPPNGMQVRNHISMFEERGRREPYGGGYGVPRGPRTNVMRREDDNDSVVSERTERDVQLLNHCFDDIEKFVARLQFAAEAYKELSRRQKNRGKSKKKVMGEGMLTMRARPPPPQDFIDIFAKFKLSFNLLAKLKAHIHDPNAPELVHFLFTPLSLVVEASKDPRHGTPDLASQVISPLLTVHARELLLNCLTSKEIDLWMSLGEPWSVHRDAWKGYVPPYVPRFYDGWQPGGPVQFDDDANSAIAQAVSNHAAQIRNKEQITRAVGQAEEHVLPVQSNERPHYRETVFRDQQQQHQYSPQENGRDTDPYFDRGPPLPPQVGQSDPRSAGFQAYVEKHIDRNRQAQHEAMARRQEPQLPPEPRVLSFEEKQKIFLRELRSKGAKVYEVMHERSGRNAKELTVSKGEILEVLDDGRNWWKLRNSEGTVGHAPYTILKKYDDDSDPRGHDSSFDERDRRDFGRSNGARPPPPPPGPPPPPVNGNWKQANRQVHKAASKDDLHNELKNQLTKGKNRNSRPVSHGRPISAVYLTMYSTTEEVGEWLQSKNFPERVVYKLDEYDGESLFKASQAELERLIGKEQGQRLASQVLVQKNLSGFKDTNSGNNELAAILQKRKQRADSSENGKRDSGLGSPPDFSPATPPRSDYDQSDSLSVSSEDQPTGNTLRDQLRRQRKKITTNSPQGGRERFSYY
ncbi:epidermal growth factor receptor kinase substrate 8-like protein 2 isoform X2 [Lingula anatina]|uniref:Epidermal growth factor receptor kinase substrate 8-like protein 2 isoform X2 n=1 Tax=Lingula anatina TaxID=7574 RepID=A0A1S3J9P9_LINAN|nr:epidermal growth factor receptor kinase substrate 8-like protein 2 isoform X2 [Lingula anatina]|eukprot:XP_013406941.1 epidermal growth factor receptor kinase substrate 8-like protein 2 isoform X2 [Lingula anatina]